MRYASYVLSSLLLAAGSGAFVQADNKAASDTDFLSKAMVCGTEEVNTAEYAAKHASDEKVKDFAQRLAKDHRDLNNSMAQNAKRLKRAVVTGVEKDGKARMDKLSKLQGDEFDREFLQQMIDGHEKAVTLFESEASGGDDADLKAVAKDNLPTLKKHLKEARELLAKLKK